MYLVVVFPKENNVCVIVPDNVIVPGSEQTRAWYPIARLMDDNAINRATIEVGRIKAATIS